MPQRGELERMSREQTQWAEIIASQQRQLMDAASHDGHSVDAYAEIARTLQVLVARIGSVDERLIRALNASSFVETQVEEQLGNLYDGLGRVARGCEVEKSTVTELVARLSQLDSVLDAIAASPRTLPGKADSAVIHNATVAAVDTVDTADTTDIVDTVDLSSGGDDDGSESMGSASKIMDSGRASAEGKHIDQFASFRSWKSMKSLASSNSSLDLMKLVLGEPATADPEPSTAASVAPLSVHDVADRSSVFTKQSVERFPDIPTDIVSPQTLDPTPLQSEGTADEVPSTKYDVLPVRQSVDVPRSHSPEEAVAQRRRTVSAVVHSAPAATSSSTKLDKAAAARPVTTRSRKFSFREELRRHAWFGKKKH
ncbi:hypothetical protein FBU59_003584 [Linderina macrospora]|uniref:Uncharacterized protein n=1 Tax=Linderina macrospora TaxID=4868 RepID=A0ACC1J825_9FUNG|nr:hypothetical protein FBU59_003584 [Linderina macrospora]